MNKEIHQGWQRHYRKLCSTRENEVSFQIVVAESDLKITAEQELARPMLATLEALRADITSWIQLYPEFRTSLLPLTPPSKTHLIPSIILRMYTAAQKVGVGPFAAVAGTVAQMLAEEYVTQSPNIIVENGGDIYIYSTIARRIALLSHPHEEHAQPALGLHFTAEDFPLALCASSATIGHSLSLGQGDLAVAIAKDGALADATATALCNGLKGPQNVQSTLDFAQKITGILGVFVQCDEAIGAWGNIQLEAL